MLIFDLRINLPGSWKILKNPFYLRVDFSAYLTFECAHLWKSSVGQINLNAAILFHKFDLVSKHAEPVKSPIFGLICLKVRIKFKDQLFSPAFMKRRKNTALLVNIPMWLTKRTHAWKYNFRDYPIFSFY